MATDLDGFGSQRIEYGFHSRWGDIPAHADVLPMERGAGKRRTHAAHDGTHAIIGCNRSG